MSDTIRDDKTHDATVQYERERAAEGRLAYDFGITISMCIVSIGAACAMPIVAWFIGEFFVNTVGG